MDLALSRIEYTEAGSFVPKGCLQVVSGTHAKTGQKVAVGNGNGELKVFGIHQKTRAVDVSYVAKAYDKSPVNCLHTMVPSGKDKAVIFVGGQGSEGMEDEHADIQAYSKRKSTPFLEINANLRGPVNFISVYNEDVFVASDTMLNHIFNSTEERGFFMPPRAITGLTYGRMESVLLPVISTADRLLRMLSLVSESLDGTTGPKTQLIEVELPAQASVLTSYGETDTPSQNILYGGQDGRFGMVGTQRPVKHRFCVDNDKKKGSVDTIATFDLTGDGVQEIVVGRSDGSVEVFRLDTATRKAVLCSEHTFSESISSVSCGNVGSSDDREVVLSTYSGRIFGLRAGMSTMLNQTAKPKEQDEVAGDHSRHVASLRSEIARLEIELADKKRQVAAEQSRPTNPSEYIADGLISIHDSFTFSTQDSTYVLVIETQIAVDMVFLRSDTTMDVVDLDKNTVLASQCAPDPANKTLVSYTLRCQVHTTRIELKFRPIEGQQGTLSVIVVPAPPMTKYKVARELKYPIRPLCLHSIQHFDSVESRPLSWLHFEGKIPVQEAHKMLAVCLPDLGDFAPDSPPGEDIELKYISSITGTVVKAMYKEGSIAIASDNVSSLAILKEFITKLGLEWRVSLRCTAEINEESVPWMLDLIDRKVKPQLKLNQRLVLWQALKEVEMSEGSDMITSPEYKEILATGEDIKKQSEMAAASSVLERLYGVITDLYIDYYKMEDINSKNHTNILLRLLDQYDLAALKDFFMRDPSDRSLWQDEDLAQE
eukprot:scpid31281/ scgid24128/ Bardet-Biedl syndrome 7 protein homolog; BBS2-like protein 1